MVKTSNWEGVIKEGKALKGGKFLILFKNFILKEGIVGGPKVLGIRKARNWDWLLFLRKERVIIFPGIFGLIILGGFQN